MKRPITAALLATAFGALGYGASAGGDGPRTTADVTSYGQRGAVANVSAADRVEREMKIKGETKRSLGQFRLSDGSSLELSTAETTDGQECLIEEHSLSGSSGGCLEGGLFGSRKVELSVSTDGGPETFSELYVTGVVAPSIRSASLELTDGTQAPLQLTAAGTFLHESAQATLAAHVYPTRVHLFGPNGKLVETVSFPPAGS
jgi:hypothetical protein